MIENGDYSFKQRVDLLQQTFLRCGIAFEKSVVSESSGVVSWTLQLDGRKVTLQAFLKNIGNSGWSSRPDIKRIQIPALTDRGFLPTTQQNISIILGFVLSNGDLILAAWNPFLFMFHQTTRSAYLYTDSIDEVASAGMIRRLEKGVPLIAARQERFKDLLLQYWKDNEANVL